MAPASTGWVSRRRSSAAIAVAAFATWTVALQRGIGQPEPLAARAFEIPLPGLRSRAEIASDPQHRRADGVGGLDERARRIDVAADHRSPGPEDAGLLAADGLARRPEVVDVVDADAGDDRDVGVDDVDRVEPPAEADLEDRQVGLRAREEPERRQRAELEIRERDAVAHVLDRVERASRDPHRSRIRRRCARARCSARGAATCTARGGSPTPAASIPSARTPSPCRWCRRR